MILLKNSISGVELKSSLQRKSDFLQSLAVGIITLLFITLLILIVRGVPSLYNLLVTSTILILNLTVFFLNRRRYTELAAHLFCYTLNTVNFFYFLLNLFPVEGFGTPKIESAVLFAYALNLTVLLAGLLIGPRATWSFATLNGILIFITYFLFTGSAGNALEIGFPPIAVLYITAIISWLYQRTLNRAHQQLLKAQLLQRDLEIARTVQQQLYPAPPDFVPHVKIAAHSEPALETSGDFYDFIPCNDHEIGVIIADVAGKSIPAAMIMTMTRSIIRSEAQRHESPARVLEGTNRVLYDDEFINQMVTAFYGQLDAQTLTLRFANAGHIYPLLKRDGAIREVELPGFPLGLIAEPDYQEVTIQLQPGDLLVLSSDGFIEAPDPAGDLFGFDRFAAVVQQSNGDHPEQLLQDIWAAVESFQAEELQRDDMTLVVIKVESEARSRVEAVDGTAATYSIKKTF